MPLCNDCPSNRPFQGDHSLYNVKFPHISVMVCGTPAHVKCYTHHAVTSVIVSGEGKPKPKPKRNAQIQRSQEWMQVCS